MSTANASSPGSGKPRPSPINGVAVAAAIVVLLVVALMVGRQWFGPDASDDSTSGKAAIGGPFTLVDQDGQTVTDQTFLGSYMLIYFGYTYCPDVCPTSLARNRQAMDILGDKADAIVPMLISIDPERDTPELLKSYVPYFHPRMVGLTGSPEQVADVAQAYKVYYARATEDGKEADDENYLVDHSSFSYLMGPDGEFIQHFSHSMDAEAVAAKLAELL